MSNVKGQGPTFYLRKYESGTANPCLYCNQTRESHGADLMCPPGVATVNPFQPPESGEPSEVGTWKREADHLQGLLNAERAKVTRLEAVERAGKDLILWLDSDESGFALGDRLEAMRTALGEVSGESQGGEKDA
jgi:hypothetical protein